jgi:hypothetical protein
MSLFFAAAKLNHPEIRTPQSARARSLGHVTRARAVDFPMSATPLLVVKRMIYRNSLQGHREQAADPTA